MKKIVVMGGGPGGAKIADGAVVVDRGLWTSNPAVLAVGDLTGEPLLSHKASAQAALAAENALGGKRTFDAEGVPTVLYTIPEVAAVGLTEQQARVRGLEVVVGEAPYQSNTRAMAELAGEGFVKIVCGARHHEILGVHILGPQSAELITQAQLALKLEATADELADLIAAHPTYAESLAEAARAVLGRALYGRR